MTNSHAVAELFAGPMLDQIPRLLTQVDRNFHSPTYGSCCRPHWHYRIDDISNSQMQEMVLALALAYRLPLEGNPYRGSACLGEWIRAILRFTVTLQRPAGSFDEVYRGQDSYAATAFVSFALSETLRQMGDALPADLVGDVLGALERAAAWLAGAREELAANQMAGAAAALFNLHELTGAGRHAEGARRILNGIGALQSREGWFQEYGGADIGYGSLSQSYLALIATRWRDPASREMALASARFLRHFVHRDGTVGGEYSSRNTEYFIPLGVLLLAGESEDCAFLCRFLASGLRHGTHALVTRCLDDRYLAYLSWTYLLAAQTVCDGDLPDPPGSGEPLWEPQARYFPEAGLWSVTNAGYSLIANLAKGGVLRVDFPGRSFLDEGVFGRTRDGTPFTSQCLTRGARVEMGERRAIVRVGLHANPPVRVTPARNLAVRAFNLWAPAALRRRFLDVLRRRAVRPGERIGEAERTITLLDGEVEVADRIRLPQGATEVCIQLAKERAFSFASTGFFQPQELAGAEPGRIALDVAPDGSATCRRRITADGIRVERA